MAKVRRRAIGPDGSSGGTTSRALRTMQELMDRIHAADKITRYFYPTRKAIEVESALDTDVRIILGGTTD